MPRHLPGARRGARPPLLVAVLLALGGAAAPPPAGAIDRIEATIKVSWGVTGTRTVEGTTVRIATERQAVHRAWFDRSPEAVWNQGGVQVMPGHPLGVQAFFRGELRSVDGNGYGAVVTEEGQAAITCPPVATAPLAYLCADGTIYLGLDPARKTYSLEFNAVPVECEHTLRDLFPGGGSSDPYSGGSYEQRIPGFEVGPLPLPAPGQRLAGTRTIPLDAFAAADVRRSQRSDREADGRAWYEDRLLSEGDPLPVVTVSWDIGPPPDHDEVTVEIVGYESWLPVGNEADPGAPGNRLAVRAWVHARGKPGETGDRKATFSFELRDVSDEPGVCINAPRGGDRARDLRLEARDNPDLRVTGEATAATAGEVGEAHLEVGCFDYGAWGSLLVKARRGDTPLKVTFRGATDATITLPRDDNGNRIADGWEQANDVEGLPAIWDGAEIPGQVAIGDGLTLYEKYRGLVAVGAAGRAHQRLEPPRRKFHFVIDEYDVFDFARFTLASDLETVRLTPDLVSGEAGEPAETRRVDFNSSPGVQGAKYAVRVRRLNGMVEPDPAATADDPHPDGVNPKRYAYTFPSGSPAQAERLRLFPDRCLAFIRRLEESVQRGIDDPASEDGQVLADAGITAEGARAALAALTEPRRQELTRIMTELCAIHEMGHACGCNGHMGASADGEDPVEDYGSGERTCPMRGFDRADMRRFLLLGDITGTGDFCQTCYQRLNVRN